MRQHPMVMLLEHAERMVEADDAIELLAYLEGWRFGPAPHVRARRARQRHARGLPSAPSVSTPGLRLCDDIDRVWEMLASAVAAHAA